MRHAESLVAPMLLVLCGKWLCCSIKARCSTVLYCNEGDDDCNAEKIPIASPRDAASFYMPCALMLESAASRVGSGQGNRPKSP